MRQNQNYNYLCNMIDYNIILKQIGIEALTPMQNEALEKHMAHNNIMLLAPTGSGKSVAFILSALQKIKEYSALNTEIVILAPSRELALQIESVVISCKIGMKVMSLYGGHKFSDEKSSLKNPPKIVIATPGRLADHVRRGTITLDAVHHVIIDEFDKCVEMGFDEDMMDIFEAMENVQTRTLTSATNSCDIPKFIGFRDPYTVDFSSQASPMKKGDIVTTVVNCSGDRLETLYDLLCTFESAPTLVFCNYRESTETVSDFLWRKEVVNDYYHGLLEQQDRERALIKLRNGSINVLVATDLAARGLDIDSLKYVVHYEMPMSEEAFIHRSGRTGRMNSEGENYVISSKNGYLPDFVAPNTPTINVPQSTTSAPSPAWDSLYIGAGKRDKISKGDIVGFLTQVASLDFSQIGTIIIRDNCSYAAIQYGTLTDVLAKVKGMKLKKSKCRFDACR